MKIFNNLNIDFIGKRYAYFAISATLLLAGLGVFIVRGGPLLSIEFTGGTMIQIGFKTLPPIEEIRKGLLSDGWQGFALQTQPSNHSIIVRVNKSKEGREDIAHSVVQTLKKQYAGNINDVPDRVEFIGSVVGKGIIWNTIYSLAGSFLLIIIYVAFRFKNWVLGFAGVFALMHDVFITWALLTFLNAETTLVVIAALLTLAGYSINDTIVIFDRVRENSRNSRKESMMELYNRSINETMSRTLNTSMTVFLASLSLLIFGGEVLRDFAIAFSFGVLIGTYSTVVYEIQTWGKKGK
jgi:preprotein translocase subunit SecF